LAIFNTNIANQNYIDDFIINLSNLLLDKIKDLKRDSLKIDGTDEDKAKLVTDRLAKAEEEIFELKAKEQDIRYILKAIREIRNEIKDKYIQSTIGKELETCLTEITEHYFPSIDILDSKFNLFSNK